MDEDLRDQMPSSRNAQLNAQRHRRKFFGSAKAPKTREEIDIPDDLIKLKNGDSFLLHDSGVQDKSRYLVFGTQQNVERLNACKKVYR